mgnify:CR=1 FL=1
MSADAQRPAARRLTVLHYRYQTSPPSEPRLKGAIFIPRYVEVWITPRNSKNAKSC